MKVEKVQSAQQMFEATAKYFTESDIVVLSAAVADYTPLHVADKKIKKKRILLKLNSPKRLILLQRWGSRKKLIR